MAKPVIRVALNLSPADYATVEALAARRGTTMAQTYRDAVRLLAQLETVTMEEVKP